MANNTRAAPSRKRWSSKSEPKNEEDDIQRNSTGSFKKKDMNVIQQLIKAVTGKQLKMPPETNLETETRKNNDNEVLQSQSRPQSSQSQPQSPPPLQQPET